MPHIHEKIDWAVGVFVVYQNKVLFIKHKKLGIWLPVGGHVEPDEDPETAALRETLEESGLVVELVGERPSVNMPNGRCLISPAYLDIHQISPTHQHIGMAYFARSHTDEVKLAPDEHDAIRWLTKEDLFDPEYALMEHIRFYAIKALERCT